jgi:hypothetical protein
MVVLLVYLFPRPILWLGNGYSDLNELFLSIISGCIGLLGGRVPILARGWAMSPVLMIAVNIASIIFLASY